MSHYMYNLSKAKLSNSLKEIGVCKAQAHWKQCAVRAGARWRRGRARNRCRCRREDTAGSGSLPVHQLPRRGRARAAAGGSGRAWREARARAVPARARRAPGIRHAWRRAWGESSRQGSSYLKQKLLQSADTGQSINEHTRVLCTKCYARGTRKSHHIIERLARKNSSTGTGYALRRREAITVDGEGMELGAGAALWSALSICVQTPTRGRTSFVR